VVLNFSIELSTLIFRGQAVQEEQLDIKGYFLPLRWLHLPRMDLGVYCRQKLQNEPKESTLLQVFVTLFSIIYAYTSGSLKRDLPSIDQRKEAWIA
jgi:hypothetical protein